MKGSGLVAILDREEADSQMSDRTASPGPVDLPPLLCILRPCSFNHLFIFLLVCLSFTNLLSYLFLQLLGGFFFKNNYGYHKVREACPVNNTWGNQKRQMISLKNKGFFV